MKKIETFEYIKKEKGFVPYTFLFDMIDDKDEIPKYLIDMSVKGNKDYVIRTINTKNK